MRALRSHEERNLLRTDGGAGGQCHDPESAGEQVHMIQQMFAAGPPGTAPTSSTAAHPALALPPPHHADTAL
ncbi:hypothetical protein RVR_2498 [Actinacidiphila reveromycinica]|uniref:Uncharacterized protein n=1 Tax=Actinacidiphila reveromycinica TaxID=659352 RepID=A0A7U3UQT2_9ACTN|nr:hypothetical protein RVR_2498 [Streptomyces sp. SN-593]